MDIDTAADIRRALKSGITKWLEPELLDKSTRIPATMRDSVKLQDEIGWNLTFCGLFDDIWGAHQEAFFASRSQRQIDETGLVWSTKVCTWMIHESRKVWLKRNEEVHQHTEGPSKAEQETI